MKHKWLVGTILIWIVILCAPALRYSLRVSLKDSPWIRSSVLPSNTDYGNGFFPVLRVRNAPVSIQVMNILNEDQGMIRDIQLRKLPLLDELIEHNPNTPWLIAARLRVTMEAFSKNRQGGELSDGRTREEIRKGPPSKEKNDNKINWTRQQMRETLELCRRGQKLEPQNGFFPWMRAYFLLIDWQDKNAMEALHATAGASYWNDHIAKFTQLFAKDAQGFLKRPLTPFEQMTIAATPEFGLNGKMLEMGRILGWEGIKLRRAGNHKAALSLLFDFYHAMTLATQGASTPIDFLVSYAMTSMAASSISYELEEPQNKLSEKERIDRFIAYAHQYHRPDLAQQIQADWNLNYGLYLKTRKLIHSKEGARALDRMYDWGVFHSSSVLLIISFLGAFAAELVMAGLHLLHSRKSTFMASAAAAESTFGVSFWQQCKGVFACSGFPSFALAGCFLAALIFLVSKLIPENVMFDVVGGWWAWNFTYISSDSTLWREFIERLSGVNRDSTFSGKWRWFTFLTPLVCAGLYALVESGKIKGSKRNILFATLLLAWGVLALTTEYGALQIVAGVICALFLLTSIFVLWGNVRRKSTFTWVLFRSSLQGWICIASIAIFIMLCGQTLINSTLQPYAKKQLRGEIQLLHEVRDGSR